MLRRRESGEGLDHDRDRVIGQHREVLGIEPRVAIRRHQGRIDDPFDVALRHECGRRDDVEPDERDDPEHRQRVAEPPTQVGHDEARHQDEAGAHRHDRREDVEPELGPPVRRLIEAQSERCRDQDHCGQRDERDERREIRPRATLDHRLQDDDDRRGETRRRDEFEEAASRVLRVRHPSRVERIEPTEQVGHLQAHEGPDDEVDHDEDDERLGQAERAGRGERAAARRRARARHAPGRAVRRPRPRSARRAATRRPG